MDLADPGNKPLSSAKVKRGARMTAARQRKILCERDHIIAREGSGAAFTCSIDRCRAAAPYCTTAFAGGDVGTRSACMRESIIGSSGNRLRRHIASCGSAITDAFYSGHPL